jgi:hypothetical protein
MRLILISILFASGSFAQTVQEKEASAAVEKIVALFSPSNNKTKDGFRVDKCPIPKQKMMELAIFKQSFTHSFNFASGCDVSGVVTIKMDETFPLNLKVRNLKEYQSLASQVALTVGTTDGGINYKMNLSAGKLTGIKRNISFFGHYNYPLKLEEMKNLKTTGSGEVTITEIDGKKANYKKVIGNNQ